MRNHCLFAFGIGMIALLFAYTPVSHAESGQTYEVDGSSVNVRTDPENNAEVIGTLNKGDQIDVFQESFGWHETYYDGQTAWIASQYLSSADDGVSDKDGGNNDSKEQTANTSETITVQTDDARLRTGPGTEHAVSGYASKDDSYTLLESADNWYKVEFGNGKTGWVASWLTDKSNENKADNEKTSSDDKEVASKTTTDGSLSGYTIVLDAGHGGKDPGSIALDGTFEDEYTLRTADKVSQKLQNAGADVAQTRTDDTFISLPDRVSESEENDADAFISLHFNAYSKETVNGFSSHYYAGEDSELAKEIQSGLTRNIMLDSRGTMKSDYHVLRKNSSPAVLLELGFITNTDDLTNIQTADYQDAVGDGIAEGLLDYFQ